MAAPARSGAIKDDMDNICELLINVVSASKPKGVDRLKPKGKGYGQSGRVSLCAIYDSPGGQADPKSSWLY